VITPRQTVPPGPPNGSNEVRNRAPALPSHRSRSFRAEPALGAGLGERAATLALVPRTKAAGPSTARPTKQALEAARDRTIPDLIQKGLRVLFVGINPGLYSGAVGHHFARPGNRFWPALARSGFTRVQLSPYAERELLTDGLGITNVVARTTARADELDAGELREGARVLEMKVRRYEPRFVAVLGVTAYREAFARPRAMLGLQEERLGPSRLWVLPNPSGLNAHHQLADLALLFAELRHATEVR
jgi:TDG/mug DNA glycosylase family protein